MSSLHKAAKLGNANQLTEVLHCPEVDVNHADKDGETSLFLASLNDHLQITVAKVVSIYLTCAVVPSYLLRRRSM